jgi:hypothetical protein
MELYIAYEEAGLAELKALPGFCFVHELDGQWVAKRDKLNVTFYHGRFSAWSWAKPTRVESADTAAEALAKLESHP